MPKNDQKESLYQGIKDTDKTDKEKKIEGKILEITSELKKSIERKDNATLNALLSDAHFWLNDRPGNFDDFTGALNRLTGASEDVELFILKILSVKIDDSKVSLSAEIQMLWTDEKTWEEDEISSVMHLGFSGNDEKWKIDYLGVTDRQSSGNTRFSHAAEPNTSSYFTAPEEFIPSGSYFGTVPEFSFMETPMPGSTSYFATSDFAYRPEDDKTLPLVPVYIPEFILIDVMKKLLKK